MIKTVTEEHRFCDICGKEAYPWTRCYGCGKDLCAEGAWESNPKPHVIRYAHGVSMSGSDDGYYCVPCDIRLSEDKSDPLHQAYVAVRELRDERERYYQAQRKREEAAEELVTQLRATRRQFV